MSSILLINAAGRETRVALIENGHIAEFYLERKKDRGIVGNIYKGRVVRVLPGMQAAFVDIGEDKAAFLYVTDVVYDPDFARAQFELTEGEHDEEVPEVPELSDPDSPPALVASSDEAGAEPELLDVQELAPGELHPPEDAELVNAESAGLLQESTPPSLTREAELAPPLVGVDEATFPEPATQPGVEVPASGESESLMESAPGADSAAVKGELRAPASVQERKSERPRREGRDRGRGGGPRDGGRDAHREEEKPRSRKPQRIEDLLKVGQEVIVQISKDPIGTKGARLTSHISIPGRHLVFMPTVDHVGISRRIGNEKERRRLREIVDRLRPPGTGFIVRTVAENVPQEKLESDIRFLIEVWNQVVRRNEKHGGCGLMHPDLDLILRATRDLFAQDVEKLVVDDRDEYERILGFVTAQDPALRDRVALHESEEPIFDAYGVEHEINRALQRKVWLKSGGYLIVDQAEALTAVDVNSGRYVGKKSLEETITKINMEAAKEIVYQLRLRNIGGIIICDFIDMEKQQNREKVFKALQEALGRDKAKTNVLRISELGLVEMTRKRVRESIGRVLHEDCSYCDGQGFVKTPTTVGYEIFREIRREGPNFKDATLIINCSNEVAKLLLGDEREELRHLMDRFNKTIQVKEQPHYHREQYDIYSRSGQNVDHKLVQSGPRRTDGGPPPPRQETQGRGGGRNGPPGNDRPRREGGGNKDRERKEGRRGESRGGPGGGDRGAEGSDRGDASTPSIPPSAGSAELK